MTTTYTHTHTVAETDYALPYDGRAYYDHQAATGGVECLERCACGAVRWRASNGRHTDTSPWQMPLWRFGGRRGSGTGYRLLCAADGRVLDARAVTLDSVGADRTSRAIARSAIPEGVLDLLGAYVAVREEVQS